MIDWDHVMECSIAVIGYILIGIAVLVGVVFIASGIFILIFGGISLILQGLWFFGAPVLAVGVVLTIAILVAIFAKIMGLIKDRKH